MPTRDKFPERRRARREAAEKQRLERAKRSTAEQLELIKNRRGESRREVARLKSAGST